MPACCRGISKATACQTAIFARDLGLPHQLAGSSVALEGGVEAFALQRKGPRVVVVSSVDQQQRLLDLVSLASSITSSLALNSLGAHLKRLCKTLLLLLLLLLDCLMSAWSSPCRAAGHQ